MEINHMVTAQSVRSVILLSYCHEQCQGIKILNQTLILHWFYNLFAETTVDHTVFIIRMGFNISAFLITNEMTKEFIPSVPWAAGDPQLFIFIYLFIYIFIMKVVQKYTWKD